MSRRPARRPADEWTLAIGVRRAAIHSLWVGASLFAAMALAFTLTAPWLNAIESSLGRRSRSLVWVLAAAPFVAAGVWLAWSQLCERAGFMSRLLAVLAILVVGAASGGAAWVAVECGGLHVTGARTLALGVTIGVTLFVVYDLMVELD